MSHGGISLRGGGGGTVEDDAAADEDVFVVSSFVVVVVAASVVVFARNGFSESLSLRLGSRSLRILSLSFLTLTSDP